MKNRSIFFTLVVATLFNTSSCVDKELPSLDPSKKHQLVLTGLKKSLGFEIDNGRTDSVPEGINNLTVLIADEQLETVYQRNYYSGNYWDLLASIPDSIWIPSLSEGNYKVMAITLDYYGPYNYYSDSSISEFLVEPPYYDDAVVFAGNEDVRLASADQIVEIQMKNISSNILIKLKDGQTLEDANLHIILESNSWTAFDLYEYQFVSFDPQWPITYHSTLGIQYYYDGFREITKEITEKNLYVFPSDFSKITFEYYDNSGTNFRVTTALSDDIVLETGEKITLVIDIDQIIAGAGAGFFDWEDIEWSDQGEITVP